MSIIHSVVMDGGLLLEYLRGVVGEQDGHGGKGVKYRLLFCQAKLFVTGTLKIKVH